MKLLKPLFNVVKVEEGSGQILEVNSKMFVE